MMTEKELISRFQTLKQIKPNGSWSFSVKSRILNTEFPVQKPLWQNVLSNLFAIPSQMKMAYAFSALLLIFVGAFGIAKFAGQPADTSLLQKTEPAAILGETSIKTSIEAFKAKSQSLAMLSKTTVDPNSKQVAVKELSDAAKSLAAAVQKDPTSAKAVATELKQDGTLAALADTNSDAKETSDIVYKPLVEQLLKDDAKTTPTEAMQKTIANAKALYDSGNFGEALILLVNN